MSTILGGCGCCAGGGSGGGDTPPIISPPPGDAPDPSWVAGFYQAAKYAQMVRDGFPDLRSYYRSLTYDTGIRYEECEELQNEPSVPATARKYWKFFPGAEQIVITYDLGGTPTSSAGEFTPGSPTVSAGAGLTPYISTLNGIVFEQAQEHGFLFRSFNFSVLEAGLAVGNMGIAGSTVVTTCTGAIPESLLNDIEEKLDAVQFITSELQVAIQWNPDDVAVNPHTEGSRSGVRFHCQSVPSYPFFFPATFLGVPTNCFCVSQWAKGSISDEQAAYTGLQLKRDKVRIQFGVKSPSGTVNKVFRRYVIPDGFNLITAGEVARNPASNITVLNAQTRIPANSTLAEEGTWSIPVDNLLTVNPDLQEVYFFDNSPFGSAIATVAEVLTPLPAKMRLYRNFNNGTLGLRFQSEDRCLRHELYRKVNAGAESLLATITGAPQEWPTYLQTGISGWSGFINPDTGFVQFPLGYEWQYLDNTVSAGNTYTYRIKSYYDTSYKSEYSAAYSVTI